MRSNRLRFSQIIGALTVIGTGVCLALASFPEDRRIPGTVKGTVTARAASGDKTPVADAKVTLTAAGKTDPAYTVRTDPSGEFVIENVPIGNFTLRVEADNLPAASHAVVLGSGSVIAIDVNLSLELSEQVTIRDEEGLISTEETTTSNIVLAQSLQNLPLRSDDYKSAMPQTPGVVVANDGATHIKGSRATQSRFSVNGADVSDPISGSPSFEIPLEAVNSVKVEDNPYSAELGQFTGGVAQVNTKAGANKFDGGVSRLFPTYGGFFTGKIESFRPRAWGSGPIVKDRLFFIQSFEYRFRREEYDDLPEGADFRKVERFTSYSQLDYVINESNQLRLSVAVYPQKTRFANLNFFTPQSASYNLKQRGYLISVSEQAVFKEASFLNSSFYYLKADVDIFGQGGPDYTLEPELVSGDYFGTSYRDSDRWRMQEVFYFPQLQAAGKHSLRIGGEFGRSNVSNDLRFDPIFFRRLNGTLTQRIDFSPPSIAEASFTEAGVFVQDKWEINNRFTLDAGARIDHDGVTGRTNFSPRASLMITPFGGDSTIVRVGAGLFFDRTLPMALLFGDQNGSVLYPERTITTLAADGTTVSNVSNFVNTVSPDLRTPKSKRFSVYLDQRLTSEFTLRVGYVERRASDDLLIDRIVTSPTTGEYRLNSTGRSRYREFQVLLNYVNEKRGTFNVSYTRSRAEGDLNTADVVANNFAAPNLNANEYSLYPFDSPNRLLFVGRVPIKWDILVSPSVEYRTGYPFSAVNERLEYVGQQNLAGRFPDYFSLDVQVTKGIPIKIPIIKKKYRFRVGVALFNLTNRFNPRDVQNSIASPNYGSFFNSQGFGAKLQVFFEK